MVNECRFLKFWYRSYKTVFDDCAEECTDNKLFTTLMSLYLKTLKTLKWTNLLTNKYIASYLLKSQSCLVNCYK